MTFKRATFEIECSAQLATDCRKTETIVREKRPNERMPEGGIVPPGWTQIKNGDLVCPECTRAMHA